MQCMYVYIYIYKDIHVVWKDDVVNPAKTVLDLVFDLKGRRHLEIDLVWKDDVVDPAKTLLDLVWKDDVVDATKAA